MSRDNGERLRKLCAAALRQWDESERRSSQSQEAATRQRQSTLANVRAAHEQRRKQAAALLTDIKGLGQSAERALIELELTPGQPASLPAPSAATGIDDLSRLLHNQRVESAQLANSIKTNAATLKTERRKWWKFW